MNKQQQIEEMGKVIPEKIKDPLDNSRYIIFGKSLRREIARIYYNAGYRKIDEFAECRNCTAWSGTDCTRHPYTQGCLKEENNIKRQAVKEFAEKLKYTWITDSDAYKKGCKETAEKIFKMLISKLESNQFLSGKRIIMEVDVENLAKQFDVEIEG